MRIAKFSFYLNLGVLKVFERDSQTDKIITILHRSPNHKDDVTLTTELDAKPIRCNEEVVTIPPGRVGIHLEDFVSGVSSTVVKSVSPSSPLVGKVFQGDRITCVNGVDVSKMDTLGKKLNNKRCTLHFLYI